jgi:hypothetical protein
VSEPRWATKYELVHLRHCYQGNYPNSCKYGEDRTCPARKKATKYPEWMEICDECNGTDPLCKYDAISYAAQKKLLEYLSADMVHYQTTPETKTIWDKLKSMLKQLNKQHTYISPKGVK